MVIVQCYLVLFYRADFFQPGSACCRCFPAPTHWIQMNGLLSEDFDDEQGTSHQDQDGKTPNKPNY